MENPMNKNQIKKIDLTRENVDCFVFWTKDARPMMKRLNELDGFNYYFQYTITGYGRDIERNINNKINIINNFIKLSDILGKERVILRYDPIFINEKYDLKYHCKTFDKLLGYLYKYTNKCVISFIDIYKKNIKKLNSFGIKEMDYHQITELAKNLSCISKKYNISLETCCEKYDLSRFGIRKGSCIDSQLISSIVGYDIDLKKDRNQRKDCGCVSSIDIGQYNSCKNGCVYCYANINNQIIEKNFRRHSKDSNILIGHVDENIKTVVKVKDINNSKKKQLNFFND